MAQLQSTGITGSLNVTGTITAQEFHTEFVSGSIIYSSGSTKFGDSNDDNHDFTGSLNVNAVTTQTIGVLRSSNTSTSANNGGALLAIRNSSNTDGNQESLIFQNSNGTGTSGIFGYNVTQSTGEGLMTFGVRNSSGTFGEKMRIDGDGNVGIGTNNPGYKLDVNGDIRLLGTGTGNNSRILYFTNSAAAIARDANNLKLHAYDNLIFGVSNTAYPTSTERMRIDSSGNVGIGTTAPDYKLDVAGDIGVNEYIYHNGDSNTFIRFQTDDINLTAGGSNLLRVDNTAPVREIVVNEAGAATDFRVESDTVTAALFVTASNGYVGINQSNPQNTLHLGDESATSAGTLRIDGFVAGQFWKLEPGTNTLNLKDYHGTSLVVFDGANDYVLMNGGNVGIGTSSPSQVLHVKGNILVEDNDSTDTVAQIGNSGDDGWINLYANGVSKAFVGANTTSYFNGGNVGIGTTSPQAELDVRGGVSTTLIVGSGGNTADDIQTIEFRDRYGVTGFANGQIGSFIKQIREGSNGHYDLTFGTTNSNTADATEKMRLTQDGNVGIGETSPSYKLDVHHGTAGEGIARFSGADSDDMIIVTEDGYMAIDTRNAATGLSFQMQGADKVRILPTGNVGIGTTSPANDVSGLHISVASSTDQLYLERTGSGTGRYYLGAASNSLIIVDDAQSAERMRIDSSGNMGIGTTNPTASLHVAGPAYFSGGSISFSDTVSYAALVIDEGDYIYTRDGNYLRQLIGKTTADVIQIGQAGTSLIDEIRFLPGTTGGKTTFYDNSTQIMVVSGSGVGIGTTAPSEKLAVQSTFTTSTSDVFLEINSGHEASGGSDVTGEAGILFKQGGSGNVLRNAGAIISGREGNYSTDSLADSFLVFQTALNGTNTERMRIDSSGNVGIGTTSPAFSAGSGLRIERDATATLRLQDTGANGFEIRASSAAAEFFNANSKPFTFETGGSEVMRIDSSGNVGIGTSSPTSPLHISSATNRSLLLDFTGTGTYSLISFKQSGTEQFRLWGSNDDNYLSFYNDQTSAHQLTLASDGNVGIGTTSPSSLLHLEDASSPALQIKDTTNNVTFKAYSQNTNSHVGTTSNHDLFIDTNNTSRITVLKDGKVGIGTTTPSYAFQLHGDAAFLSAAGSLNGLLTQGDEGKGRLYLYDTGNPTIAFQTNGSSYFNSGNVGIGTTSPDTKLEIVDSDPILTIRDSSTSLASAKAFLRLAESGASDTLNRYVQVALSGSSSGTNLTFDLDGNEKMRIDEDGNVGIGTSSPGTVLDIHGTGNVLHVGTGTNVAQYMSFRGSGASGAYIGYDGVGMMLQPGDGKRFLIRGGDENWGQGNIGLSVDTDGNVGIGTTSPASISSTAHWLTLDADNGSSASGGIIHQINGTTKAALYVYNDNVYNDAKSGVGHIFAVDNGTEAMRINSSGNVGIGTTSPDAPLTVTNNSVSSYIINVNMADDVDGGGFYESSGGMELYLKDTSGSGQVKLTSLGSSYLNGGNVGIGTASPSEKLEVTGNLILDATDANLKIKPGGIGTKGDIQWTFNTDSTVYASAGIEYDNRGTDGFLIDSGYPITMDFAGSYIRWQYDGSEKMRLNSSGNVGIGTTSPDYLLDVNGDMGVGEYIYHNGDSDTFIRFQANDINLTANGQNLVRADGGTAVVINEGQNDVDFRVESNNNAYLFYANGGNNTIGILESSPESTLHIKQRNNTYTGGLTLERQDTTTAWQIYTDGSSNLDFNQGSTTRGYLVSGVSVSNIDFTGQHRSLISTTNDNTAGYTDDELVGLIVVSDGTYSNISGSSTSPQINEALPNVSLSETAYDKKVYGVISSKEDIKDGNRNYAQGMFVTVLPTGSDEQRLIINSVGEGGMWVCNYSGSIENGDYITSSPIKGLGMKQNNDILHNYTVAKITQDCDFNISGSYTEFNWSGSTYRKQFVGVTYHAG